MHAELYISFLVAMSLLAMAVIAIYMALRLPPHKAVSVPQAAPTVFPAAQSVRNQVQPISDSTAEALKQTDENLKKRIIKLATKVMLNHHLLFGTHLAFDLTQGPSAHALQSPILQYCLTMHDQKQICKHHVNKSKSYFTLLVLLRQSQISKPAVDLLSQAPALHTAVTDHYLSVSVAYCNGMVACSWKVSEMPAWNWSSEYLRALKLQKLQHISRSAVPHICMCCVYHALPPLSASWQWHSLPWASWIMVTACAYVAQIVHIAVHDIYVACSSAEPS